MKKSFQFFKVGLLMTILTVNTLNAQDSWNQFKAPGVKVVNQAPANHAGIQKYRQLVSQQGYATIADWVQHCCKVIAQEVYSNANAANSHGLDSITYILTDGGALSAKRGAIPHIEISFDLNYIVQFSQKHSDKQSSDEIYGVLCHELVHGYQKEPKNAGTYRKGDEFYGFIEGTADLGRLLTGGFNPARFPQKGGDWKNGYLETGFFYLWLTKTKDPNFLRKLNETAAIYSTWLLDKACKELLGYSAEYLWLQYQNEIKNYPWHNPTATNAGFYTNNTHIYTGETILFNNISSNSSQYIWKFPGGTPETSTQLNPTVRYMSSGNYPVMLIAIGTNGTDTMQVLNYINVYRQGDIIDITNMPGNITAQYNDSPSGEGIEQLIDNDSKKKFLTFHPTAWVQFESGHAHILTSYSITSSEDSPARDPKDWTLKGSNDGTKWHLLDNRSNEDFPQRKQRRVFQLPTNNTAYTHYRLEMTHNGIDNWGNMILQLSELELFGRYIPIPVSTFSSNKTTIKEGETVSFYDQSLHQPNSWQWSFPGGIPSFSNEQNPTVHYPSAGSYPVTLKVENAEGNHSKTINNYIEVSTEQLHNIMLNCGNISSQYNDSPHYEAVSNLIDGSSHTKFLTFQASSWIIMSACKPYIIKRYSITSANDAPERDPKDWVLLGSNDKYTWYIIDTRNNQSFVNRREQQVFEINNTMAFNHYKLEMTNNKGNILQVAEVELLGSVVNNDLKSGLIPSSDLTTDDKGNSTLEVTISPIPASTYIYTRFSEAIKGKLKLYSSTGQLVLTKNTISGTAESVYVGHLPAGLYILLIETDSEVINKHIIIK